MGIAALILWLLTAVGGFVLLGTSTWPLPSVPRASS